MKNQQVGAAILIDSIDKMASIATGGARNKKRMAMSTSIQGLAQPPSSMIASTMLSNPQAGPSKRMMPATPPPNTSMYYQDSPPRSPSKYSFPIVLIFFTAIPYVIFQSAATDRIKPIKVNMQRWVSYQFLIYFTNQMYERRKKF